MPVTKGFTLIELLIVSTVMILILTVGLPAMDGFRHRMQARQDIAGLKMLLHSSREQAMLRQTRVTLCPLVNNRCSNDWNQPLSLFTDPNNNRQLDNNETVLHILAASRPTNTLRNFNNHAVSFDSRGFAGASAGSFSYCLNDTGQTGLALIISRNGRIRKGTDSNHDGLPETADGKNVQCPS